MSLPRSNPPRSDPDGLDPRARLQLERNRPERQARVAAQQAERDGVFARVRDRLEAELEARMTGGRPPTPTGDKATPRRYRGPTITVGRALDADAIPPRAQVELRSPPERRAAAQPKTPDSGLRTPDEKKPKPRRGPKLTEPTPEDFALATEVATRANVARVMRAARLVKRLSTNELATLTGVARSGLDFIEVGTTKWPTPRVRAALTQHLGMHFDETVPESRPVRGSLLKARAEESRSEPPRPTSEIPPEPIPEVRAAAPDERRVVVRARIQALVLEVEGPDAGGVFGRLMAQLLGAAASAEVEHE